MKITIRRAFFWVALPGLVLIAAAVVIAPYLSANEFRPRIQAALERGLRREVTVGEVHFTLLHGPGFQADHVVIKDSPGAGIEPFAYVNSLEASLRLSSLFTGRFAFDTLRLDDPTVNLVKAPSGVWNVQEFMSGDSASAANEGAGLPDIQIRSGRLNFKFGDVKSVFYFNNADVDVYRAGANSIGVRFTGEPSRTDRAAAGFGSVSGRGLLNVAPGSEAHLSLGLVLERSNLSEIVTLLDGHDVGVHGFVTASAHLAGPLSHIAITGDLNLSDLHRWDLIPAEASDSWPFQYKGEWDVPGQNVSIHTAPANGQPQPVSIDVSLASYLSSPQWTLKAAFQDVPAAPVVETARRFGVPLPVGIRVEGKVNGGIAYAAATQWSGELDLTGGSITSQAGSAEGTAQIDTASAGIQGGRITFGPAALRLPGGESASLSGTYDLAAQNFSLRLETDKLSMEQVQSGAIRALGIAPPPLLAACRRGLWRGWAGYEWRPASPGAWSGRFELLNTDLSFPDLAVPFRMVSASVALDGSRVQISKLRGRAGKLTLDGDLRYDTESARPAFLRLHLSEGDILEMERVLDPVLERQEGLLARLRIRRAVLPEWLRSRRIEGRVQVDDLFFGPTSLGSVSSHFTWNGPSLRMTNLRWIQEGSEGNGAMEIDLTNTSPRYRLSGKIDYSPWRQGNLSVDGVFATSGTGEALLDNASAEGTFEAQDVALSPEVSFDEVSGTFQLRPVRSQGQLRLLGVRATQDQEAFAGQGASQSDGRILLELNSARRQIRELTAGLSH
ncbi:MAG TPA: AsmA family protein [Bryobacteraceae bacterium]|jgi:hypothetical protein|nr:AsmA family protein [Bryobacteraceae bacterium]